MTIFTNKLRNTGICLITAAVIALPQAAHAGWFSSAKPVKQVVSKARSSAAQVKDRADDVNAKLQEITDRLEDNRPLVDALKNGRMMQQLTEVVEYLNESQQDYQAFADSGVYVLRDDIRELVSIVGDINNSLNLDSKLSNQLDRAAGLVDKMPVSFLFALTKSGVDQRLQDIIARLRQLRDDLVLVASLPLERDVFLYPEMYKNDLCPLVIDDDTRVQLAVLNARIDSNIWVLSTVSDLLPEDLTISATVVGGGGTTVSKFPPQYIFKTINTILGAIKLRMGNYKSIAESMCSA